MGASLEQRDRAALRAWDLLADLVGSGFTGDDVGETRVVETVGGKHPGQGRVDEVSVDQRHPPTGSRRSEGSIGGDRRLAVGESRRGNDNRLEGIVRGAVLAQLDTGCDKPESLGGSRMGSFCRRERCGQSLFCKDGHIRDQARLQDSCRLATTVEATTTPCQ